ncbi:hypothetical protein [Streptomyces huiliensis]|uniref:hypothetical protein n=1 Tax=Streptomyces huiliensis TaxID=2876027 RepID=UPI001CC0036C|nr:hypothetical protein [Streptomyces huiliensis]MBZ4323591.1 hypothetical protein [Streptomyces huiliensis]
MKRSSDVLVTVESDDTGVLGRGPEVFRVWGLNPDGTWQRPSSVTFTGANDVRVLDEGRPAVAVHRPKEDATRTAPS